MFFTFSAPCIPEEYDAYTNDLQKNHSLEGAKICTDYANKVHSFHRIGFQTVARKLAEYNVSRCKVPTNTPSLMPMFRMAHAETLPPKL